MAALVHCHTLCLHRVESLQNDNVAIASPNIFLSPLSGGNRISAFGSAKVTSPRRLRLTIRSDTNPTATARQTKQKPSAGSLPALEVDVAIVGAGIIGLSLAHELLTSTDLRVALIDAKQPCAGATGAGQGYIWMAHRLPGGAGWDLAARGKELWEALLDELQVAPNRDVHGSPPLGWRNTGSMLVGSTEREAAALRERVLLLQSGGVRAHYLSAAEARAEERHLSVPDEGGAALVPGDSQLDAELAVDALLRRCRTFAAKGRYHELFGQPAQCLLASGSGRVEGVQTSACHVAAGRGVVLAAGPWSGTLMDTLAQDLGVLDAPAVPAVRPRKGHLLVLDNLPGVKLTRALMEAEYTANYGATPVVSTSVVSASGSAPLKSEVAVSMTATSDHAGRLLIGKLDLLPLLLSFPY
eukprot:jgi/Mesen1/7246/ME000373S06312